jgi:hypothetical protein
MKKNLVLLVIRNNRRRQLKSSIPASELSAAYDAVVSERLYQRRPDAFALAVEACAIEVITLENAYREEADELYNVM